MRQHASASAVTAGITASPATHPIALEKNFLRFIKTPPIFGTLNY
jgi:hypothetical protein